MRYSEEFYQELDAKIDKILQLQPNITARKLASVLEIDYRLALKRMQKVRVRRLERIKRADVTDDIATFVNFFDQAVPEIVEIIFTKKKGGGYKYSAKERIFAFKTLVDGNKRALDMKMDAGIFKRELGKLEVAGGLNPEQAAVIKEAIDKLYGRPSGKLKDGNNEKGGKSGDSK